MERFKIEFDGKQFQAVEIDGIVCAECALTDYIDPFYCTPKEGFCQIDDGIAFYTDSVLEDLDEAGLVNRLIEEDPEYFAERFADRVRRCSVCGKVMQAGWMDNYHDWHACSDECRDAYYSRFDDPESTLAEDLDNDCCFYTEWESPFYD